MFNIDRHIAFQAGWVAGPAFGVAMMAAPEYLHLGPAMSAILFWGGIGVFLATIGVVAFISLHEENKRRAVIGPIIVMTFGALLFCVGAAWYFWPRPEVRKIAETAAAPVPGPAAAPAIDPDKPENLEQLFRSDFERTLRTHQELTFSGPDSTDRAQIQIYYDLDAGTYFLGLYVPRTPRTFLIIQYFLEVYQKHSDELRNNILVTTRDPADINSVRLNDFPFSKRVYVYHENELSLQEIAALDTIYREKGLALQLRGSQYQTTRWLQKAKQRK